MSSVDSLSCLGLGKVQWWLMEHNVSNTSKLRLFLTQFLLPQPIELIPYFFVSLLALLVASNQTLLVILSDGSPITDTGFNDVFSQRLGYLDELMQTPILGRIILFLFWLAIGSIVYMFVWLFQNLVVEVYDDVAHAKLGTPTENTDEDGNWWGTTLSHTIFVGSSIIVLLFFVLITVNFLFPAAVQLFEIGLQTYTERSGILKLVAAILGTMFMAYVFVLFWRLFFRLRSYIYNSF